MNLDDFRGSAHSKQSCILLGGIGRTVWCASKIMEVGSWSPRADLSCGSSKLKGLPGLVSFVYCTQTGTGHE